MWSWPWGSSTDEAREGGFKLGEVVEYYSASQGAWIPAKVVAVKPNSYDLDCKPDVPPARIRSCASARDSRVSSSGLLEFEPGDVVEYFSISQNDWILAKVLSINASGTYNLDCKPEVPPERVRAQRGSDLVISPVSVSKPRSRSEAPGAAEQPGIENENAVPSSLDQGLAEGALRSVDQAEEALLADSDEEMEAKDGFLDEQEALVTEAAALEGSGHEEFARRAQRPGAMDKRAQSQSLKGYSHESRRPAVIAALRLLAYSISMMVFGMICSGVLLEQSSGWGFGLRGHAGSHPAARRAPPRNAEVSPETLGYLPAAQSVMCILSGLASSMMALVPRKYHHGLLCLMTLWLGGFFTLLPVASSSIYSLVVVYAFQVLPRPWIGQMTNLLVSQLYEDAAKSSAAQSFSQGGFALGAVAMVLMEQYSSSAFGGAQKHPTD
eukprot:g22374.t1